MSLTAKLLFESKTWKIKTKKIIAFSQQSLCIHLAQYDYIRIIKPDEDTSFLAMSDAELADDTHLVTEVSKAFPMYRQRCYLNSLTDRAVRRLLNLTVVSYRTKFGSI